MKTPLLAALGFALLALAMTLYLFSGTKAQEPAGKVAQSAARERNAPTLDTPREIPDTARAAEVEAQREATETSASATVASRCVVRVVDERRQPLEGVALFAFKAAEEMQHAETDTGGRASFDAAGAVQLFAIASARPVQRFDVELTDGERELVLDAPSASVAGIVTVAGAPPNEPVQISLSANTAPLGELELPEKLRTALSSTLRRSVESSADGAFEFAGLAPDWSGKLTLSGGYELVQVDARSRPRYELSLEHPRSDLRLELKRLPRIVGRFETAAGEAVRTSERPRVTILSHQGRARMTSQASIDEHGRFVYVLRQEDFDTVEMLLDCDLGRGARTAQRSELAPTPAGDFDLGAIVLTPQSSLSLRAVSAGAPVARAKARVTGDLKWAESDAEGRIHVRSGATGAATLRVLAPDFWALDVPVFLPVGEELVVELAPANVLTITVRDATGIPLARARVVFKARVAPLFSESNSMNPQDTSVGIRRGAERGSNSSWSDDNGFEGDIEVVADDEGVVELQGLAAEAALSVSVVDALGEPLVSAPIEPLGASERRKLEFKLPAVFKSLRGRVLDPDGRPVASASVSVRVEAGGDADTRTDSSGRFALESLSADQLELKVDSPHFAPRILPRVALLDTTTELEIRLERGRIVVVELVDDSGAPQSSARVVAATPDGVHHWTAAEKSAGRYQFKPLHAGPLTVSAHLHSRVYTRELADRDESVRIVVPTPGQLTVRLANSVDLTQRAPFVRLRSLDGGANDTKRFPRETPRGPLSLGPLAPGEYELIRVAIGSTELGDAPGVHKVEQTLRVTVRAGETTEVELP